MMNSNNTSALEFYDFTGGGKAKKLTGHTMRLRLTKGKNHVVFSRDVSEEVFCKGCTGIRMANNPLTNEWFVVFTTQGAEFKYTQPKGEPEQIMCYNKALGEFLRDEVCKVDYDTILITLSIDRCNKQDTATYKILDWEKHE